MEIYQDDILVDAATMAEHDVIFNKVVDHLCTAGLKLNSEKCEIRKTQLEFQRHHVSGVGIGPHPEKSLRSVIWGHPITSVKSVTSWEWSTILDDFSQTWQKQQGLSMVCWRKRLPGLVWSTAGSSVQESEGPCDIMPSPNILQCRQANDIECRQIQLRLGSCVDAATWRGFETHCLLLHNAEWCGMQIRPHW